MSRSDLTIGTHQLSAAEVVLIRTLVRLYAHEESFNWVYQASGPCDALLVNGTGSGSTPPFSSSFSPAILSIVSADEGLAANTLARPIKAEKLQEWLKATATHLLAYPNKVQRVTPVRSTSVKSHTRFKLRRWPPSALMRNDPALIRMSTLLSRRSLLLTELAELSQQSLESCTQFIQSLQPVGLLELESVAATGSGSTQQRKVSSPSSKSTFGKGFISGIRRRLGL